jgi:hypothetical protein
MHAEERLSLLAAPGYRFAVLKTAAIEAALRRA